MSMSTDAIKEGLIARLAALSQAKTRKKAMVGFDGYVDYIQKAVKSASGHLRSYFDTITSVSQHLAQAAGKSAQIELRTFAEKMGGNAPIMAHALGSLRVENYCFGMLGDPEIHPVFHAMSKNCTLVSIGAHATSHALEFDDGKIILSEVSTFDDVDFSFIGRSIEKSTLTQALQQADLIAMVDWSNMPLCTRLWESFCEEIGKMKLTGKTFFFDLCDPSKKTHQEIRHALEAVGNFKAIGTTVLGLNENEATKIFAALEDESLSKQTSQQNTVAIAEAIFQRLDLDVLLVHPVDRTIVVTNISTTEVIGPVVRNPKILTGGGDNLNAGFCLGLLNGFSIEESMITGMATSGAYIRNGFSPSVNDLIGYIKDSDFQVNHHTNAINGKTVL